MERLRSVTITIEVDTNKRTERVVLDLDDVSEVADLPDAVRERLDGILRGIS